MELSSSSVALLPCPQYRRREVIDAVGRICSALKFNVAPSTRVLLKPNLLSARSMNHLACTQAEFVGAVAEWFVAHGALVAIGDSPAFGTAKGVMRAVGIRDALANLPVSLINFDDSVQVTLAGGVQVGVARAALECDLLVNLPRVKAHSQLFMTLAVKNYFGIVTGFQKPGWHLRYGDRDDRFASHLVDLLAVVPDGITLLDGITAMHITGPIGGQPFPLGMIAGSTNPVAVDSAMLNILKLDPARSVVWRECFRRGLTGSEPDNLDYPLDKPSGFTVEGFQTPTMLKPVSFNPLRMMVSGCRRIVARLKESS